jgi:Zn-dependent protease
MNPNDIINIVLQIAALMTSVVFHEVAHGLVAYRLGDPTAKSQKRLSLNPIRHIDPIGTIVLPGILALMNAPIFGFAKPVPVNPNYFRHPHRGMMWVAIAGPITNFSLATLTYGVLWLLIQIDPQSITNILDFGIITGLMSQIAFFFIIFFIINIILGLFNLLPIPPLDGSRVLSYFLPDAGRQIMFQIERFGILIVLGLVMFGGLKNALDPIFDWAIWALEQLKSQL